jgi:hypothetical protein
MLCTQYWVCSKSSKILTHHITVTTHAREVQEEEKRARRESERLTNERSCSNGYLAGHTR